METRIIKADGSEELKTPENGNEFTLKELKETVNGYIEIVHLNDDNMMVVNEEGKLNNFPINEKATKIYQEHAASWDNDFIVGDVLICQNNQIS